MAELSWKDRAAWVRDRLAGNPRRLAAVVLLLAVLAIAGAMAWWAAALILAGAILWTMVPLSEQPASRTAADRNATLGKADVDMLLEAVPGPLLALDRQGRIVHANRRAREFFATSAAGQHISQLRREPDLLEATEAVLLSGGTRSVDLVERVPIERRLRVTLTALAGDDAAADVLPRAVVFVEDLTEQAQLAEMRADFVANASHELRTPLTSLKGFVETLKGAAKDDPAARGRFLDIMQQEAGRMTRLIDDLLSLSRVEMREHLPPTGRVDLAIAVPHVVETMTPLATASGVALRTELGALPLVVRGDRDEIIQVVQNLIENAIKYRRQDGARVDVSVAREAGAAEPHRHLAVRVTDNGPGIAPEHIPRLTERFYRVSARQSREKGGTGLGLAIVKHIVNRHGGELVVRSRLGEGSTFTVRLPEDA